MNLTKLKPLSGRRLPILFLIVIPVIFFLIKLIPIILFSLSGGSISSEDPQYLILIIDFIYKYDKLFLFLVSVILLLGYGLYPYTFSAKRYFKKLGNYQVVEEYEFLKKIIYIILPIAIIDTILIITISNFVTFDTLYYGLLRDDFSQLQLDKVVEPILSLKDQEVQTSDGARIAGPFIALSEADQEKVIKELYRFRVEALTNITSFVPLVGPLVKGALDYYPSIKGDLDVLLLNTQEIAFLVLYTALFRLVMHEARKEFRYYFAIALFEISNVIHKEIKRIQYLVKGLNSYDKYMKRSLNLQIKNLKEIQEKIAVADSEYRNILLQTIHEEKDDRFDIIKKLSEFLSIKNMEDLLEPENIKLRFVEVSPFVAAVIIPIIVAVIQFFA